MVIMMEKRSTDSGKALQKSKNAVLPRKDGNSVPTGNPPKRPAGQGMVMQSSVSRNAVSTSKANKVAKRRPGAVVGMKQRKPSSLHAVRSPKIITIRKKEKTPFPIAVLFTSVIITVLFLFMMMNYAEIDKYNSEIARLDAKVTRLKNEEHNLSVRLDKKDNLVDIEEYATKNLGMVKSETLPRRPVNLQPIDKGEIIKYDDGREGGFGFLLAGIGEVISEFLK